MRSVALLFVIACGGTQDPTTTTPSSNSALSNNDAVLATVYLHELAEAKLGAGSNVCLVVRGEVTDFAAVLATVRKSYPKAVADSECSGGGPTGPVVLKAGGNAVRLDIGPITWVNDTTATITGGGAHAGGPTASEYNYTVVKHGAGWKVESTKPGLTI